MRIKTFETLIPRLLKSLKIKFLFIFHGKLSSSNWVKNKFWWFDGSTPSPNFLPSEIALFSKDSELEFLKRWWTSAPKLWIREASGFRPGESSHWNRIETRADPLILGSGTINRGDIKRFNLFQTWVHIVNQKSSQSVSWMLQSGHSLRNQKKNLHQFSKISATENEWKGIENCEKGAE